MYQYQAKIIRVVDGDTVELEIDLGFGLKKTDKLRVANVDTPEVFGRVKTEAEREHGKQATERAKELLPEGSLIVVDTIKEKGKYGRIIAKIRLQDNRDFGTVMTEEGFAKRADYSPER